MEAIEVLKEHLLLLIPLVLLQLILMIIALTDLVKRERVMGGSKIIWALVILFVTAGLGPIIYLVLGRRD
ncbi:MAG: negative regulator of sigma-Y activity [Firmicutes bacterium]|nr:negative regulator of sigma-Y activity [Bacillota bacterium]